jgi:choline dehydrogenase-like flavoprotein
MGMVIQAQPALGGNGTGDWCPSKYGPEDQAGAPNEITPGKVLEAVRLVRRGRVYDLAHVLHQDIPAFPGRTYRQYLTTIAFDAPGAEDPLDLARHSMDFWLTTGDLPLAENRVTLGRDGRIRLRYTPTNIEAHRRLRGKFEGRLDAIQCRDTVPPGYHYLGGRLGINSMAHLNGTVRFGTDPATSAPDVNCKLHELDHVYVADSSFFCSSTAVNPALTIIANAPRVADHIAGRLGAGRGQAEPVPAASVPSHRDAAVPA